MTTTLLTPGTRFDAFPPPEPLDLPTWSWTSSVTVDTEPLVREIDLLVDNINLRRAKIDATHVDVEVHPLTVPVLPQLSEPGSPAAFLDDCLQELHDWLGVGLDTLAPMAGINRGTVYAWRLRGSTPRPRTTGSILRLHGLVAYGVQAAGVERAMAWFRSGEPSPVDELVAAKGDPAAVTAVSRRLRRALTSTSVPAPNLARAGSIDDLPLAIRARLGE